MVSRYFPYKNESLPHQTMNRSHRNKNSTAVHYFASHTFQRLFKFHITVLIYILVLYPTWYSLHLRHVYGASV